MNSLEKKLCVQEQNANFKWISCDMCLAWFHGLRQNIQNSEVDTNIKSNTKYFEQFCDLCLEYVDATREWWKHCLEVF